MWPYVIKVAVTAVVVVAVSEVAKRSPVWAALLASLPLTSLLAFVWLYLDTGDSERVATLSHSILSLVLPALVIFVLLPILLRAGWGFRGSLASSCAVTAGAYLVMVWVLGRSTIETFRIVKANQVIVSAMREESIAQIRPYVQVTVFIRTGTRLLYLLIRNAGRSGPPVS